MDVFLILVSIFHFFAGPLLIIGLIWLFFVPRRLYREKRSLEAFKGNEMARAMVKDRLLAGLFGALGLILWPWCWPPGLAVSACSRRPA